MPSSTSWPICSVSLKAAALATWVGLGGACASHEKAPVRIAVAPVDVLGAPASYGAALCQGIKSAFAQNGQSRLIEVTPPADTEGAAGAHACLSSDACLLSLGKAVTAERLLALSLAGLASTSVVRTRVFDVDKQLVLQDLQETVVGGEPALQDFGEVIASRLFPAPAAPWYRQTWVWVTTGVGASVAGAVTYWALSRSPSPSDTVHLGQL